MKDEILVAKKIVSNKADPSYVVKSIHQAPLSLLSRRKSLDSVDIQALNDLGFAIAYNELDEYGKKVYIKHNLRTRKETRAYLK